MQKEIVKYANVLYHKRFLKCGGVERYETELCKKYSKLGYEIDLFYEDCLNDEWLEIIEKAIGKDHVHKYHGEIIYCNTLFINYDMDGFIDNVIADEVINVIHANFMLQQKFKLHTYPTITKRLGVSDIVSKAYDKRFGLKCKTCYNPIVIEDSDKKRVLTLISATRLTEEKGKDRMIRLINELDKNKIPFYYHIFTNDIDDIKHPNVFYHKPTIDIRPYIANADYTIQLSSSEGYSYTVLESLCLGTPVIVSDLEVFKEMGVNKKNGFILPLDMKDIPIDEIYHANLKGFNYIPRKDDYEKYLYKGKTKIIKEKIMRVKIIRPVFDSVSKVHYVSPREYGLNQINHKDGYPNKPVGTIVDLENERAKVIVSNGYAIYVEKPDTYVEKVIDEVKKIRKPRASKTNLKKVK